LPLKHSNNTGVPSVEHPEPEVFLLCAAFSTHDSVVHDWKLL
jgi:hypothetical protein